MQPSRGRGGKGAEDMDAVDGAEAPGQREIVDDARHRSSGMRNWSGGSFVSDAIRAEHWAATTVSRLLPGFWSRSRKESSMGWGSMG